jgi:hypothetical protein
MSTSSSNVRITCDRPNEVIDRWMSTRGVPGQAPLDRDGHLLLDLLRRLAGVEGDHHDLDVRDVRERLDLQLAERDDAEDREQEGRGRA